MKKFLITLLLFFIPCVCNAGPAVWEMISSAPASGSSPLLPETLTSGSILLGNGGGEIQALGVATNGQIPVGDGTGAPQLATLTGTANEITITNGAGTITISIPDSPVFVTPTLGAATGTSLNTSSFIAGLVSVGAQTGEYTLSAQMQKGGVVLMTTADDVNLNSATVGDSFMVIARDAETFSLRPDASDTIKYPGLSLNAGDELDSPGTAEDRITCVCLTANTWYCNGTAGFTDGGAGD